MKAEYWSNAFHELNVAINYEKKLIHVYCVKQVTYEEGFEKYKDNMQLVENWWLMEYLVGATRTERVNTE